MKFFKKLFGNDDNTAKKKIESVVESSQPENTELIEVLNAWGKKESPENYDAVIEQLNSEETFLLLPSIQDVDEEATDWKSLIDSEDNAEINSVFEVEGHSVLTVFSDKKALTDWSLEEIEYTQLPSKRVLEFAEKHKIGNIVINSGLLNMFILELHADEDIEEETPLVEIPEIPLSDEFIEHLTSNFENAESILEAYQFSQVVGDEKNLIVGIKLTHDNEPARTRMIEAINRTLNSMEPNVPFGVMIMDNSWLSMMESIDNKPFFIKE